MTWDSDKPEEMLAELMEQGIVVRYDESSLCVLGAEQDIRPAIALKFQSSRLSENVDYSDTTLLILTPAQAMNLAQILLMHLQHMPAADAVTRRN